ncbi:hypothetical protein QE152_g27380 [Popillia japonica]|uniref:Uncharacterized protein n=1 Tax=Popillia japonica TaxID=7064 RepID=A0AAW1JVS9_POPJA
MLVPLRGRHLHNRATSDGSTTRFSESQSDLPQINFAMEEDDGRWLPTHLGCATIENNISIFLLRADKWKKMMEDGYLLILAVLQ